jgi:acyl-CoA reductase LuxC
MSATVAAGRERVERLLEALARVLAPGSRERAALGERLLTTTGLSPEGIEWALDHCLERAPTEGELTRLSAGVAPAPRAHVILPGNVFVAAHRALALALAASPRVVVKASRRDPALVEALHAQAPELFELVRELAPAPGDHVFAYGSDVTLEALRRELPAGSVLHAHGSGFGVALVELKAKSPPESLELARAIAIDTACFDQRGCLSPRFVLALGEPAALEPFAEQLARALAELEQRIPLGSLDPSERADSSWWRQTVACFGVVLPAGSGAVSLRDASEPALLLSDGAAALAVPPVGRHLELVAIHQLEPALAGLRPWLTTVGCSSAGLQEYVSGLLDPIRVTTVGSMQRPAFDGPVDRRADPRGEVIARSSPPARSRVNEEAARAATPRGRC